MRERDRIDKNHGVPAVDPGTWNDDAVVYKPCNRAAQGARVACDGQEPVSYELRPDAGVFAKLTNPRGVLVVGSQRTIMTR